MTCSPQLRNAFDDQDHRFAAALKVLSDAVEEHAFPGASFAITRGDELVALKGVGRFTYDSASPAVDVETIWDLASVTKVIATTAVAMILYERGELDLEMPLAGVVPEFAHGSADPRRGEVTLRMLLAHSSGLPSYYRMYEHCRTREELLQACHGCELDADPGTRAEYSDIGFILLGLALERIAGEGLSQFCRRKIFGPLGMPETTFNPPAGWHNRIPPSEDDQRFRQRVIQGEVNDENAFVMGGVAGHAGAFSTALNVARFGHAMLQGCRTLPLQGRVRNNPILRPETIELFTQRESSPPGTCRALGWDTPSQPSQSGKHFSPTSFGHLGFTGTSLWCDPERQISVTLLTNRTWPDRSCEKIKQVRPKFHDAVMEALL
jgi:serine-type D-Ala-D-Ala carboxypeptidase